MHKRRELAERMAKLRRRSRPPFTPANFRTILSHQHAGIIVVSGEGVVTFVNEAFCAQFGFSESPDQLEGCPAAVIHARINKVYLHPRREQARIAAILARNEPVRGDEVVTRDGRVFLRDFSPITIQGDRQGRIWQQRDITEQKMYETRVERLAFYDELTGLPNRRLLFDLLARSRAGAWGSRRCWRWGYSTWTTSSM